MKYFPYLILTLLPVFGQAGTPYQQFDAANRLLDAGKPVEAIAAYDSLLRQGWVSPELYLNLGNAHYQADHTGWAIVHYQKALRLRPSWDVAQHNLAVARQRVVDLPAPFHELGFVAWAKQVFYSYSPDAWAWIAVILGWLGLAAWAGSYWIEKDRTRAWVRRVAWTGLILGTSALGLTQWRLQDLNHSGRAVIIQAVVPVRDTPGGQVELVSLHEGVEVEVFETSAGWTRIRLHAPDLGEVTGYLETQALGEI
ncbi:MAG: tetratricopeptide repeat protein [Bacteroidia bacterium]|nr:tetratricopeptide repeat protein [Bacteroidia bacterium]